MSPPAKTPANPVIRSLPTSTTWSEKVTPGTSASTDRSASWPRASTRQSASRSSNSPVGWGKPDSSSRIFSITSLPSSARATVDSQRIVMPSSSASVTSESWAGIRSRVRRYTTTASDAPSLRAVRAASMAVFPPP